MADKPKTMQKRSALFGVLALVMLVGILSSCTGLVGSGKKIDRFLGSLRDPVKEVNIKSRGIDVARYQGTIDWEKVAQSGVEFAMIRVGYRTQVSGEIAPDTNARYNMQQAAKYGIKLGAYFFSTAVSKEEAREEAAWVADFISQYPITYPVAYNCEGFQEQSSRQKDLGKVQRTEVALEFLKSIENYGYEAMFYASKGEMTDNAQWMMERIQDDYKVWVAQYPGQPYPEEPSYEGPYEMWQYTNRGRIPGIPRDVDCDTAWFSYDGVRNPKDQRAPEEAYPDPEALMSFRTVADEAVTALEAVNLRDHPSQGADSNVCHVLGNGEVATRIGVSDSGWSKVIYDGRIYYCLTSYLTTDLDFGPGYSDHVVRPQFRKVHELVTTREEVNLRDMPAGEEAGSQILGKLMYRDIATRVGISDNGWSRIEYQGETYYCVSRYLIPADEISPEDPPKKAGVAPEQQTAEDDPLMKNFVDMDDQITPNIEVNLRTRPTSEEGASSVVALIANGEVVHRTGIDEDLGWSRVEYQGRTLYCFTKYIQTVKP